MWARTSVLVATAASTGFLLRPTVTLDRAGLVVGALALFSPSLYVEAAGLTLVVAIFLWQRYGRRGGCWRWATSGSPRE